MTRGLLVALALFVLAPPATAATLPDSYGVLPHTIRHVLHRSPLPVPQHVTWAVDSSDRGYASFDGEVALPQGVWAIDRDPDPASRMVKAAVTVHELGHEFDMQNFTDENRRAIAAILGRSDKPWWGTTGPSYDADPPNDEFFAQVYAALSYPRWRRQTVEAGRYRITYGSVTIILTPAQLGSIRYIIERSQP